LRNRDRFSWDRRSAAVSCSLELSRRRPARSGSPASPRQSRSWPLPPETKPPPKRACARSSALPLLALSFQVREGTGFELSHVLVRNLVEFLEALYRGLFSARSESRRRGEPLGK